MDARLLLLVSLLALATLQLPRVEAQLEVSLDLPFSVEIRQSIGELVTPDIPVAESHVISLRTFYDISGSVPLSVESEKDRIFSQDTITMTFTATESQVDLEMFITLVVETALGEPVYVREVKVPTIPIQVPRQYNTGEIPVNVPLSPVGIPLTVELTVQLQIDSALSVGISAERVEPSNTIVTFGQDSLSTTRTFSKSGGVGAKFEASSIEVIGTGVLLVSAGIAELPLFLHEFPPLQVESLSSGIHNLELEILKLRTPIEMTLSSSADRVPSDENFFLTAQLNPPIVSDVVLQERSIDGSAWVPVDIQISDASGLATFSLNRTAESGRPTREFRAISSEGEYTFAGESNSEEVEIFFEPVASPGPVREDRPDASPADDATPILLAILLVTIVAALSIILIIRRRQVFPR